MHFDEPISFKSAQKIVTSPNKVASHSFFPFISYSIEAKKVKKDNSSNKLEVTKKPRPIAYSSHVDSHIYSYYSNILSGLYEQELENRSLEESILAFRSLGKNNIEFAHDAFMHIKSFGECAVVALDFSKFFTTLDHEILKEEWSKLIGKSKLPKDHFNVYKSLTRYSEVDRDALYDLFDISIHNPKASRKRVCEPKVFREEVRASGYIKVNKTNVGIPQGSPISALLSNIYMLNFDEKMKSYVDSVGGKYFRYCDDMLFIVPLDEKIKVEELAIKEVNDLKVTINTDKTEIREFKVTGKGLQSDKPLQYLGFLFNGENVYLRSSSLARYSEKMKGGVKLAKSTMAKRNYIKYEKGEEPKELYKRKLYERYSHLGKRNFITYGLKAAEIMDSKSIKKQLKPLWDRLQKEME